MFPSWKQEDCFPVIKDTIFRLCKRKESWVLFDEIVNALLEDATVLRFIIGIDISRDEKAREVVSNMVAWFSQKITEFENGTLPENYRQIDLIEETYGRFDRREIGQRYAYRLRSSRDVGQRVPSVKKRKRSKQKRIENRKRREEFRRFVEELKKEGVTPEEYRERIMKWRQRANRSKN